MTLAFPSSVRLSNRLLLSHTGEYAIGIENLFTPLKKFLYLFLICTGSQTVSECLTCLSICLSVLSGSLRPRVWRADQSVVYLFD